MSYNQCTFLLPESNHSQQTQRMERDNIEYTYFTVIPVRWVIFNQVFKYNQEFFDFSPIKFHVVWNDDRTMNGFF